MSDIDDAICGFDYEDEFDGCEHGVGFDEDCEDCEDDPIGCLFPGKCLMPGEHLESECHTAEMMGALGVFDVPDGIITESLAAR